MYSNGKQQLYLSLNLQAPVLAKNGQVSLSFPGISDAIGLCHGSSPSFRNNFHTLSKTKFKYQVC